MEKGTYKVGDMAAITPKAMETMKNHCHPKEIPAHNYGKIVEIVSPLQKDEKGRYLHPYPYNAVLGKYDYVTVEFPDEKISFPSRDLMLLY